MTRAILVQDPLGPVDVSVVLEHFTEVSHLARPGPPLVGKKYKSEGILKRDDSAHSKNNVLLSYKCYLAKKSSKLPD